MSDFGVFGRNGFPQVELPPEPAEELDYAKLIFKAMEDAQEPYRTYLGASSIGYGLKCKRQLWYKLRREDKGISGKTLRLFGHGDSEEVRLIRDMKKAGIQVTGEQLEYKVGALTGHIDGLIVDPVHGLENLEVKTANKKRYTDLVEAFKGGDKGKHKLALADWRVHNAQMQLAMGGLGLATSLYAMICKDNDELHFERIPFDPVFFAELVELIEEAAAWTDDELPKRGTELPDQFGVCQWCAHFDECWGGKIDFNW